MDEEYRSRLPVLKYFNEANGQNNYDIRKHSNKFIEAMAMESRIPISNRHFLLRNNNDLVPPIRTSSCKSSGSFINKRFIILCKPTFTVYIVVNFKT